MLTKLNIIYHFIIILSITCLMLPGFCFAQADEPANQLPKAPETFEEVQSFVIQVVKGLPGAMKQGWQEAREIWQQTWVKWWDEHIKSWLQNIWQTIKGFINTIIEKVRIFLGQEIEKRKPFIEQEFEKEKQEIKEELPKVGKGFWERFKELIK